MECFLAIVAIHMVLSIGLFVYLIVTGEIQRWRALPLFVWTVLLASAPMIGEQFLEWDGWSVVIWGMCYFPAPLLVNLFLFFAWLSKHATVD